MTSNKRFLSTDDIQNYFDNIDPDEELSDLDDDAGGDGLLVDFAEYERSGRT